MAGAVHPFQTDDPRLNPIAAKVLAEERLSADDALALYRSHDILAIGWLANQVRERRHGDVAYFNVNRHINPTNVCVAACRLCAFGRKKDAPAPTPWRWKKSGGGPGRQLHAVAGHVLGVALAEAGHELRALGARPDQGHLALEDVPELRQLVEGGAAQQRPDAGGARVVTLRETRAGDRLRVRDHGPELHDQKWLAVQAHAQLAVEHAAAVGQVDGEADGRQQRPQHQQAE